MLEQGNTTPWWRRHLRTIVAVVALALVMAFVARAVNRDRAGFLDTVGDIGWSAIALSTAFAVAAVASTYGVWAACLSSLGVRLPRSAGVPVFFVSQVGKYLPGSVWPVLAQMEAGRRAGASRRTMLSAGLLSLLLGITVGSVIACVLLPFGSPEALRRYWWLLLAVPFLLAALHPRVLPTLLDRAFALLGRPPLDERPRVTGLLVAATFSALSWVLFGGHVAAIAGGLGVGGPRVVLLSIGAMAMAVSVGILAIPFPAGAGIREGALVVALSPILSRTEALALSLVSRVELIVVDVTLAAGAALLVSLLRRRTGRGGSAGVASSVTRISAHPSTPETTQQEGTTP